MELISISEAAKKLKIPVSAVRYYIDHGLLAVTDEGFEHKLSSYEYDELCKIVLLQTLGITISDISLLQKGDAVLSDVLKNRINAIMADPDDITQAGIVCQNIRLEGSDYRSLDAMSHIEHIRELKSKGGVFPDISIPGDTGFTGRTLKDYNPLYPNHPESSYSPASDPAGAVVGRERPDPDDIPKNEYARSISDRYGYEGYYSRSYPGEYNTAGSSLTNIYPHPLQRFFARLIDSMIYLLICTLFIRKFMGFDPMTSLLPSMMAGASSSFGMIYIYSAYFLMFLIEPLVITLTGTTAGKSLVGIRILNRDGNRLTLKESYLRSFRVLRYGFGFMIPLYIIYRMFRSLIECQTGRVLGQDSDIMIRTPDKRSSARVLLFIPAILLISFVSGFTGMLMEMPGNRAPLSEDAFYENVAYIAGYNSISTLDFPEYELTVENGIVTSVSFTISSENEDNIYVNYYPMYVAFMAFSGAQPGASAYDINYRSKVTAFFSDGLARFAFDYCGTHISNEVETIGYSRNILSGYLYKNADSETHTFRQTFTISLTNQ